MKLLPWINKITGLDRKLRAEYLGEGFDAGVESLKRNLIALLEQDTGTSIYIPTYIEFLKSIKTKPGMGFEATMKVGTPK